MGEHRGNECQTQGAIKANTRRDESPNQQEPQRSGRGQTAAFINHMVAADYQRAVKYMINKTKFNRVEGFIKIRNHTGGRLTFLRIGSLWNRPLVDREITLGGWSAHRRPDF